ncbi:MAG: alpha/beta hydrolase family protein [Pyrinomonadaceae bacterium]
MKLLTAILTCLLILIGATVCAAQNSIAGEWVGGYEINGNYTPVKAHFKPEDSDIKATFDLPMREENGVALNQVRFQSPNLQFELPRRTAAIIFDGKINGDAITGTIQQGDGRGTFHLVRTVIVDSKIFDQYVGDYQIGRDKYISIGQTNYPTVGIVFTESDTNRFGQLFPTSETTFFGGTARLVPYPVEINVTFVKNKQGRVTALKWKPKGFAERTAKKVKLFNQEEVKFSNGDVTLAGTLTLPLTKGPYPAVLLIHGSDPNTRFKGLPQLFARHGIAALSYDKRGAGASTGDLSKATFDDLAGDASTGVQFLQNRQDINSKQVGLWAISQGGWIAPLVAARTPNVAFMILHAGASVTPKIQARMELENSFPIYGYSQDEIKEAAVYQTLYFDAMQTDEAWEKLQAAYKKARAQNAKWIWNPGTKEQLRGRWFRLIMDFDPAPVLEKVRCPVLAFFGEKDVLVPPGGNIPNLEQALQKGGNKDYTIKILPKANHRFEETTTGANDFPTTKRTVPGYYDVMFEWLKKRINAR